MRIVAYYDSNPHNPTGLVRDEEETKKIGKVLRALSERYKVLDNEALKERMKDVEPVECGDIWIKPGIGHQWVGSGRRVCIIDDMIYDGLQYDSNEKPFPFAQVPELYKDTLTLFGLSKVGLASLRAGLIIGSDSTYLRDLQNRAKLSQYFPARPALHAMEAYFSMDPALSSQKEKTLARMRDAYRVRGLLMKALINGMDAMPELNGDDRNALIKTVKAHKKCDRTTAVRLLQSPINGVHVLTTPRAGFSIFWIFRL